jgi:hypothetical protein
VYCDTREEYSLMDYDGLGVCVGGGASYCERADKNMRRLNQQTKRPGSVHRLAKIFGGRGREGGIIIIFCDGSCKTRALLARAAQLRATANPASVIWLLFSTISNHA